MSGRLDTQLRTIVAIVALDPCCLCGAASDQVGMFVPEAGREHEFGAPPGKRRMLFYAICDPCLRSPHAQQRAENVLRHSAYRVMRTETA